ncbi:hypothetical protein PENSPDRAFT_757728 [Peniophora sp. CONT]|nr:hypothetical protein PENSPDRAFT_757728 [Peniophora sp. CONT]
MSTTAVLSIPELLAEIFACLKDVWPAPDASRPRPSNYDPLLHGSPILAWLNITFVCAQWRRLALGCSTLWIDITEGLPRHWIDVFVERSGSSSVILGNRYRDTPVPIHYESTLMGEPDEYSEPELPQAVYDCLARPNPILERCELLGDNASNSVNLNTGLFSGDAPRLRHFFCNLNSITFPWGAPFITQLQSLVICCRTGLPPISELVGTLLRSLCSIEWLDLAYLPDLNDASASPKPVHMPHIRKLGLEGSTGSVAFVLEHLRVPEVASIELRCTSLPSEERSRALFSAIHSLYESRHFPMPVALYINQVHEIRSTMAEGAPVVSRRLHISAWSTATSSESLHPRDAELEPIENFCTRPSSLLVKLDGSIRDEEMLLRDMVSHMLPFSRASILHAPAVERSYREPPIHERFLRIAPQIETLHIGRTVHDKISDCQRKLFFLLSDLLANTRKVLAGRAPGMLLPKLRILHVDYDAPGTWHPTGSGHSVSPTDLLRDLILARAAVGVPLRVIRIVDSSFQMEEPRPRSPGNPPHELKPITIPDEIRALLE